jgi:hypothetical protein
LICCQIFFVDSHDCLLDGIWIATTQKQKPPNQKARRLKERDEPEPIPRQTPPRSPDNRHK